MNEILKLYHPNLSDDDIRKVQHTYWNVFDDDRVFRWYDMREQPGDPLPRLNVQIKDDHAFFRDISVYKDPGSVLRTGERSVVTPRNESIAEPSPQAPVTKPMTEGGNQQLALTPVQSRIAGRKELLKHLMVEGNIDQRRKMWR
jgi:hypothetical protein